MELDIQVKYLPGSPLLEHIERGNWVDLYTYEDITLLPNDYKQISLGVAMRLPQGYEAIVAPRSSTFKRYGLIQTNGIGIIDNSYCGDGDIWQMPVYATRAITIPKGTRLCQFRVQEAQSHINFQIVDSLGGQDRSGFGSSGV